MLQEATASVQPPRRGRVIFWLIFSVISSAFTLGGLYSALFFVVAVGSLLSPSATVAAAQSTQITVIPGPGGIPIPIPIPRAPQAPQQPRPSIVPPCAEPPCEELNLPIWEDKDRVNILLMGVDQRPDQRGQPSRTDTMMIATIDPVTKSAGLLSLPRDLLVAIPGFGENRINTAHFMGDYFKAPGGGPALAKQTVQLNLGVKIHYYARIDFGGFEKVVNTLDGILIDVPRPLRDDEYPAETEDKGSIRLYIAPGLQRLEGRDALRYARSRHSDSDIGRMRRQQQVLLAMREQALSLNAIRQLPQLVPALRDAYATDLDLPRILALANLAWGIKTENITSRAVDDTLIVERYDGALVPKRREIGRLVREFFFDGRLRQEGARLEVLNGSQHSGFAATVAEELKFRGFTVAKIESADSNNYRQTVIIDYTGEKKY
ncbi:MAG: LCP family protein, partial [Chloroflexi bacterium]|nr:LCP family protein [Chloroflexota bacterium]